MNAETPPNGISQDQRENDGVDVSDARAATRAILGSYNTRIVGKVLPEHEQYELTEYLRCDGN